MGCCGSANMKASVPPVANPTDANKTDVFKTPNSPFGEINLTVIIPKSKFENESDAEAADSLRETNSPSPTGVNQRSRKSVTFNPISMVKEYQRDLSITDKSFTTYLTSQLGEDNWSDDESDGGSSRDHHCGNDDDYYSDYFNDYNNECYDEEYLDCEYSSLEYENHNNSGDGVHVDMDVDVEYAVQEGDPTYIPDFDFDYQPDPALTLELEQDNILNELVAYGHEKRVTQNCVRVAGDTIEQQQQDVKEGFYSDNNNDDDQAVAQNLLVFLGAGSYHDATSSTLLISAR